MVRKLKPVPDRKQHPAPPDLRDAVDSAIGDMSWNQDTDAAIVALAKHLASRIMETVDRAEEFSSLMSSGALDASEYKRLLRLEAHCDVVKTLGWLGPQLQGVLKEIGGTPTARRLVKIDQPVGGALAALRDALPDSVRDTSDPGEDDPEDVD